MSTPIYTGVWINWSQGPIRGATLTLDARNSGLLTAFIATFVTIVGAQLWKILSYIIHQLRSRRSPQDGLYHQQQVVFRNSVTPGSAAWTFLLQGWYWGASIKLPWLRTLPWLLFALLYIVAFGLLAIFSSEISKSQGTARRVYPTNCGHWDFPLNADFQTRFAETQRKQTNDTLAAETYARTCYDNDNPVACGRFPVKSIESTKEFDVACPWPGMCLEGETSAFRIRSKTIDSHHHLGINAPASDRIQLENVMTCAPLRQEGYVERIQSNDSRVWDMGYDGDEWQAYHYGPILDGLDNLVSNYTFIYNTHTFIGHEYDLEAVLDGSHPALGGRDAEPLLWHPIDALHTNDAEMTMLFLVPNGVLYWEPCDDPWFTAHQEVTEEITSYSSDLWVSPMACKQQFEICGLSSRGNRQCTGLVARLDLPDAILKLDLNLAQQFTFIRISLAIGNTMLRGLIRTRKQNALRAQDTVVDLYQNYLPRDQWTQEISGWFHTGLSMIQHAVAEYPTGPAHAAEVRGPNSTYEEAMCWNQIINETGDTTSFSIVGMVVLFVIGGLIIIASFILDTVVGWVQQRLKVAEHARMSWILDDKLQLQKLLGIELDLGHWKDGEQNIPTTHSDEKFLSLAAAKAAPGNASQSTAFHLVNDDHVPPPVASFPGNHDEPSLHKEDVGVATTEVLPVAPTEPWPAQDVRNDTQQETSIRRKPVYSSSG